VTIFLGPISAAAGMNLVYLDLGSAGKKKMENMKKARQIRQCLPMVFLLLFLAGCAQPETRSAAPRALPSVVWSDEDRDGFPDSAELASTNDRQNLRRWMAGIAEWQYYQMSEAWNENQRDCAGLVRFALREALRRHDRAWFQAMNRGLPPGGEYEVFAPDVAGLSLDHHPMGEKLFRIDFGVFQLLDLANGKFAEFADARSLKNYNTVFIGRDPGRALPGDLLFFHQPWVQRYPYHVMIYLGAASRESGGAIDWVVYHTGSNHGVASRQGVRQVDQQSEGSGEMKKVRLSMLQRHPDPRWHPVTNNRHFLGFFRLKILD
jgi:uncharacterized protein